MRKPRPSGPFGLAGASLLALGIAALLAIAPATASALAAPPPLPIAVGSHFVGNLSSPGLTAGQSGSIDFTLTDGLNVTIHSATLSLNLYAFNGFPGNQTSTGGLSNPPILSSGSTGGAWANYTVGTLSAGASIAESASVVTSSATPIGAYAIRFALTFETPNATTYLLESRGWFSDALWEEATSGPNGTTVLDGHSLALLGVSGVLAETSVQVTSSALSVTLYVVLAGAFLLAGVGGYVYYRRTSGPRSGAR